MYVRTPDEADETGKRQEASTSILRTGTEVDSVRLLVRTEYSYDYNSYMAMERAPK